MVLEQFLFLKLDFWQCFIKEYQWPECMGPLVGWIDFPPYSPCRGIQKRRPRWRQRKNCRPQLLIIWFWLTSKPVWCRNKYRGFIFCALMACYLAGRGKAKMMKCNIFTCTIYSFKDQTNETVGNMYIMVVGSQAFYFDPMEARAEKTKSPKPIHLW